MFVVLVMLQIHLSLIHLYAAQTLEQHYFIFSMMLSCTEFHRFSPYPCRFHRSSKVSSNPPRWIGYTELPLGVNECFSDAPLVMNWHPIQSVFPSHTQSSRDRLRIHLHPDQDQGQLF